MCRDTRTPDAAHPSGTGRPGAERDEHRTLAGFMAAGLCSGIANGTTRILLPLYAATLHAGTLQIGLISGLQFLGLLVLSIPIGLLLERIDGRMVFRLGGLGGAATYALLFPQAGTAWQLTLCVALFALLNPLRMVITQTEFIAMLPRYGRRKAGWNRAAHTSGLILLGPGLGATVLALQGFRAAFLVSALALLFAVLIGDRTLSRLPPRPPPAGAASPGLAGVLRLLRTRADLRGCIGIELAGQAAMTYFTIFIVLIGMRQFGMGVQAASLLVTLQGLCFVAVLFGLGAPLGALGEYRSRLLALAVLVVGYACLLAATAPWMLATGAVLTGAGLGVQHLLCVHRFGVLAQELGRGRIGGIFTIAGPTGSIAGAVLGGLVGERFGLLSGFWALLAVFALQLGHVLLHPPRSS